MNRSVAVKKTNIDKIINECNIPLQIKNDNQKKMNEINENINFLHNLHWSNKTESNSHILRELMKDVFESEKDLFAFKQYLDSLQLSNTYCDDVLKYNSIGPLHKYDKDDKLFWRKVKGDGNCFYRAFLFAFFENIIFTSNISYLVNILYDFKLKINKTKFHEMGIGDGDWEIRMIPGLFFLCLAFAVWYHVIYMLADQSMTGTLVLLAVEVLVVLGSGLLIPVDYLPEFMQVAGKYLPLYQWNQFSLNLLFGYADFSQWMKMAGWLTAGCAAGVLLCKKD